MDDRLDPEGYVTLERSCAYPAAMLALSHPKRHRRPSFLRRQLQLPLQRISCLALGLFASPLALVSSCSSAPVAEDWLAVGFDTPAQTLRTFQTGLKGDNPDLEYDSFSAQFRREQGLSELLYRELRDEVFGRFPYLRRFVELEIVREIELDPKSRTMIVRLSAFWNERWVEIRFVRDDYFSVRSGDSVLADDYANFSSMITINDERLILVLPTESPVDPGDVTKVIVGQEWKIDGFRALEGDEIPIL